MTPLTLTGQCMRVTGMVVTGGRGGMTSGTGHCATGTDHVLYCGISGAMTGGAGITMQAHNLIEGYRSAGMTGITW